jgi:hypothetical protein
MLVQNIKDYGDLLDNPKLLRIKDEGDYWVVKYTHKAFWDNLWDQYPLLKQARGHIFEKSTGNIVTRPFSKVMNYGENGAGLGIDPEASVVAVEKVNGFLGVVTCLPNGERLYSTTGTLSSDYANLVKKHCENLDLFSNDPAKTNAPLTWLFEICDESDPHIVSEDVGAYLIGLRNNESGYCFPEDVLDILSSHLMCHRPVQRVVKFKDILQEAKECRHEGFMIRDVNTGEYLCKLKSPYYLFTKFLARLRNEDKLRSVWGNDQLIQSRYGEEFIDIFAQLRDSVSVDEFLDTPEQDRIEMIRRIVYEKV